MIALFLAILLVTQDPAPKPYTPDWKPTAPELIALIDKETHEPKLRYLLERAKKLGPEGAPVFVHALASENPWLRRKAGDAIRELKIDATPALPRLVTRLAASPVKCEYLRVWNEGDIAMRQLNALRAGRDSGARDEEAEARQVAGLVGELGKRDPAALVALLAPVAPPSIENGWSLLHLAYAQALKGNAQAASELLVARWKDAPLAERLLLAAGCAEADLAMGPAQERLAAALSDPSPDLRRAACAVLAQQPRVSPATFVEPLKKLLPEAGYPLRLEALALLVRAGDAPAGAEVLRLVNDPDLRLAGGAVSLIAGLAAARERTGAGLHPLPANTVEVLVKVIEAHRDPDIRARSLGALSALARRVDAALTALQALAKRTDDVGEQARIMLAIAERARAK